MTSIRDGVTGESNATGTPSLRTTTVSGLIPKNDSRSKYVAPSASSTSLLLASPEKTFTVTFKP